MSRSLPAYIVDDPSVKICERRPGAAQSRAETAAEQLTRATTALEAALTERGSLSPAESLAAVSQALPQGVAQRLTHVFVTEKWLAESARVAFDAPDHLDGLPWQLRELCRLALFGPGGQGAREFDHPSDNRRRDVVFQQLSADVMREAHDPSSLSSVSQRAMHHPEVCRDPTLAGMMRAFIAEREGELRARLAAARAENDHIAIREPAQPVEASPRGTPSVSQIRMGFERLQHEFEERLVHFDLSTARKTLERIEEMQKRYPDALNMAIVGRCRVDLARVETRKAQYEQEIERLAASAAEAAQRGDHDQAARALQRLSSLHATRPQLLPDTRYKSIRDRIEASGEQFEHREVAKALLARERAVAAELRKLAGIVHDFHVTARRAPHDSPEYLAAEQVYRAAVKEIRHHDSNWLADLMIELDEMIEELHDPTGRAEAQVNRFILSVRTALGQIIREAREIASEQAGG